jgi:hypothetical protein
LSQSPLRNRQQSASRNHNAVTVLDRWQSGKNVGASKASVGLKSAKRGGSNIRSVSPRGAMFAEKISSGCVTDRGVKIVPIERYRLRLIEAINYLASAHPILFALLK